MSLDDIGLSAPFPLFLMWSKALLDLNGCIQNREAISSVVLRLKLGIDIDSSI